MLINIFTYYRFFFCLVSHMIDMRRAGLNFKHPHGMIYWLQISALISRLCTRYLMIPKPPSMAANRSGAKFKACLVFSLMTLLLKWERRGGGL